MTKLGYRRGQSELVLEVALLVSWKGEGDFEKSEKCQGWGRRWGRGVRVMGEGRPFLNPFKSLQRLN